MAAVAAGPTVNITINDIDIAVPKGELIVEAVKRVGLEIPIFCYHPRMKPVGMCRMCLVETGMRQPDGSVRKMPKPQAACTLPASEGLVVYTDSAMVHNDRRGVLEFLLINHPLDCPVCDRGGECPLQNNTLFYGPSTSRYVEIKRHAPKAFPLSQYVSLDLERCIQCGRCVRFTEEISGDSQLAFRFRGASMQPSTFEMRDFTSKFSGNVIEICPVGALTSRAYRFRARPWDLETRPAICTVCSNGCNVWFDYRGQKLVRINGRTNEAVNEEWTCDRGKFGHSWYNSEKRLSQPLLRKGAGLAPAEWADAYTEILKAFSDAGGSAAALASSKLSNEDLYMLRRTFRRDFGSDTVAYRFEGGTSSRKPSMPTKIAELETAPTILVFGTSLADEEPIVFLRVRKAWYRHGARVIVANDQPTDVDSFAHTILRYKPGTAAMVAEALKTGKLGIESETGVTDAALREVASLLVSGVVVLTTTGLADELAMAALEGLPGATLNVLALGTNEFGASRILDSGSDVGAILRASANGEVKALWLAGVDPFDECGNHDLVHRALENVEFLVVQASTQNEATAYASVVLPMTGPAEQDGSYTNVEGRVQRVKPVLRPLGEAKPAWRTFAEVSLRSKPETPLFQTSEVMTKIAAEVSDFAGVTYDQLGGEGYVLGIGPDAEREAPIPFESNG